LFGFVEKHLEVGGIAVFPKGETWQKEIDEAQELWSFEYEEITSQTNPNAAILKIKEIARV
jgi:16S rRNA (guanine527-N7)-methyltransferase